MKKAVWLIAVAAPLALNPAVAQTVVDGDTLRVAGKTYRLWGIDAPEIRQTCDENWQAGAEAAKTLTGLTQGKTVTCDDRSKDRYGRTIALCRANGEDLSATMVKLGMAWAFVRYSKDYVALEEKASEQRLGVHAKRCELPWNWRLTHKEREHS
jgi:endonuclease YncB( thermonuclease family)